MSYDGIRPYEKGSVDRLLFSIVGVLLRMFSFLSIFLLPLEQLIC